MAQGLQFFGVEDGLAAEFHGLEGRDELLRLREIFLEEVDGHPPGDLLVLVGGDGEEGLGAGVGGVLVVGVGLLLGVLDLDVDEGFGFELVFEPEERAFHVDHHLGDGELGFVLEEAGGLILLGMGRVLQLLGFHCRFLFFLTLNLAFLRFERVSIGEFRLDITRYNSSFQLSIFIPFRILLSPHSLGLSFKFFQELNLIDDALVLFFISFFFDQWVHF